MQIRLLEQTTRAVRRRTASDTRHESLGPAYCIAVGKPVCSSRHLRQADADVTASADSACRFEKAQLAISCHGSLAPAFCIASEPACGSRHMRQMDADLTACAVCLPQCDKAQQVIACHESRAPAYCIVGAGHSSTESVDNRRDAAFGTFFMRKCHGFAEGSVTETALTGVLSLYGRLQTMHSCVRHRRHTAEVGKPVYSSRHMKANRCRFDCLSRLRLRVSCRCTTDCRRCTADFATAATLQKDVREPRSAMSKSAVSMVTPFAQDPLMKQC
ncbi:hypothetical protein Efla_004964 [Eimeria flavescens]